MPDQVVKTKGAVTIRNETGRSHLHVNCEHCGPWIDHWVYHTQEKVSLCGVLGCEKKAVLGAHVKLPYVASKISSYTYIIPMCAEHNQATNDMKSKVGIKLVYAEQAACGEIRTQDDA